LVYLSHQAAEFVPNVLPEGEKPPPPTTVTDPATGKVTIIQPPIGTWVTRYFLDVVDYADPTTPTVRKPVNIPGQLRGLSHAGSILYTVAPHWDPVKLTSDWTEWLDASAYDGVSISLIDSLKLPVAWPHPVEVKNGLIIFGRPAENDSPSTLETWSLADTGKFIKRSLNVLSSPATYLVTFGDLLGVQLNTGKLQLYNITDAPLANVSDDSRPVLIGEGDLPGCLGYNLQYADGSAARGLWVPLGVYGVERFAPKSGGQTP